MNKKKYNFEINNFFVENFAVGQFHKISGI